MTAQLADWLARLETGHPKVVDLGLDRCSAVYRGMGFPRPAARVISVAGTNGKGSVVAFLRSILNEAGLACGSFTSPHILRFNERITVRGAAAGDAEIIASFETVEAALEGISLSYFEFTTLAALQLMSQAGLDVALLEVGLGGRLDSVNLVDADCAVITPIGLDHQEYLGDDREAIGFEKAGIMRPRQTVVCGDPRPPKSLRRQARRLGVHWFAVGKEFTVVSHGEQIRFCMGERRVKLPQPELAGGHQVENLSTALAVIGAQFPSLLGDPENLARGILRTDLPGRLQRWPQDRRILLDVGHNPHAAQAVAAYLAAAAGGERLCVLGMLADKDAEAVAGALQHQVHEWLCGGLDDHRGQSGARLARRVRARLPGARVNEFDTIPAALAFALGKARADDTILVFGSFRTVADAWRALDANRVQR